VHTAQLLTAHYLHAVVMDQIFIENRIFYTPPALDATVNFNSLQ